MFVLMLWISMYWNFEFECWRSNYGYVHVCVYDKIVYALTINYIVLRGVFWEYLDPRWKSVFVDFVGWVLVFRKYPKYKGDSVQFFHKNLDGERLAWGLVPMRRSRSRLGRDNKFHSIQYTKVEWQELCRVGPNSLWLMGKASLVILLVQLKTRKDWS